MRDTVNVTLRPASFEREWKLKWEQIQAELLILDVAHPEPMSGKAINAMNAKLQSFYVMAYHLKDALKVAFEQDPALGVPQDIEDVINNDPHLELLANLCNLEKHVVLKPDKKGKVGRTGNAPIIKSVEGTDVPGGWRLKVAIEYAGKLYDGLDLAGAVVKAWTVALKSWHLS